MGSRGAKVVGRITSVLIVIYIDIYRLCMWYTQVLGTFKGIGQFFFKWSVRITKMTRHRLMTKRKNVLIFGQSTSLLYQNMHKALKNNYEITRIYTQQPQPSQTATADPVQDIPAEEKKQIEVASKTPTKSFYQQYRLDENYDQLEKILENRQFDSIVVLPVQKNQEKEFNFEDQGFAVEYLKIHEKELMRNIFSYRLASKYLTTSGVLLFSASERDFLKAESEETLSAIEGYQRGKWYPSCELIDAQVTFLGVIAGQRDHTDLNSWSIVAMSKQWLPEHAELVSKHYCTWAAGQHLPMPGSFALFKRKTLNHKAPYLEYI